MIFGLLIFIHECGHYICARIFKVTIKEFAIGMGPKLVSKKSKKTGIAYSLRLFPVGGFVSMVGEDEVSDDPNALNKKPVWQRIIITAAGAFMNLFVGMLVMGLLVTFSGRLASNVIYEFTENSVSDQSGLMPDDRVTKLDGQSVHIGNELVYEITRRAVKPVDVTVIRSGEEITISGVSFGTEKEQGVVYGDMDFIVYSEAKTFTSVIKHTFFRSVSTVKMIWESLFDLVTGRYGVETVSGPVGVTKALAEQAKTNFSNFIYLSVVISMNLGVMNLLPLPALDGGRLLFQFIELVRRKPVKPELEGMIHFAGIVCLMLLMLLITMKDVVGLFG